MPKALIFVIDPSSETRTMYADYLRHHGYDVAEAMDGPAGVALHAERRPDAVVTELSDQPSWKEAIRMLRWPEPGRETPIVACSSRIDPDWPFAPIWVDVDMALPKPAPPSAVLRAVQQVLARRSTDLCET